MMQQVITANRLQDGAVVFLGAGHRWVDVLGEAKVFAAGEAASAGLHQAQKDEAGNLVIDVYAVDVADRGGVLKPVRLREAIRAEGPTVYPEHGKSAARERAE